MKQLSFSPKLFLTLLFISFVFLSESSAQNAKEFSPWVKRKVSEKREWYAAKGLNLRGYDWSDSKLNEHLGEIEGSRIRKNIFGLSGGLQTLAGLSLILIASGVDEDHNFDCGPNVTNCDADYVRTILNLGGSINLGVSVPFWVFTFKNKKRMDLNLVGAMERFREIR